MTSWLSIIIFLVALILSRYSPRTWVWLAILTIPAYMVKLAIGPIPTNLSELILLGGTLGWVVRQPAANFRLLLSQYKPIWWQLVFLVIGLIVGVVISGDTRLSLGIIKGWFIVPILFYGVVSSVFKPKTIGEIVSLLMLSTLPISLTALVQVATNQFVTIDGRASAWFASANYLSLYLVPILLLGSTILFERRSSRTALFFWVIAVPSVLAVYFSYSYGGWLALAAGLIVIGLWQFRAKWQYWLGGLGAVILASLTQLSSDRVARMLDFNTQSSASVRLQVWATDWLMIKERWLTGIGLGQYPARYPEVVARLFNPPLESGMLHAHNLYFQFIINLGLVGLAGFAGLIVTFFGWVRRCSASCAAPLTAAMVAILVHGLVDTPYWKNDLSILFWVLIAIANLQSQVALDKNSL